MTVTENVWMTCSVCGVTQPWDSLESPLGKPDKGWYCTNKTRCAEWRADLEKQRAEFERAHPVLVVIQQPSKARNV